MKDLDQKIPSFPKCDNYGICRASNPNPLNDDTRTNDNELHQQLCGTFKIDYLQEMDIITKAKSRLECKINVTLLALLPNKIASDSRGPATSSDRTGQDKPHSRNKRAIPLLAIAQGTVVLLNCGCLSLNPFNPFIEFRIWNNSSSPDVLNVQASISISPKYVSKSKKTSHCDLLLHDCTNAAI